MRRQPAPAEAPPRGWSHPAAAARVIGLAGLACYNWWVAVALGWLGGGALLTSPGSLFSDLEATGRPYANVLRSLDVVAGTLILLGLLLLGRRGQARARRQWRLLVAFAVAVVIGGLFPYVCAEGVSVSCRAAEWHLQLPWRHYVHVAAGIVEFLTASGATLLACRRTAGQRALLAWTVRGIGAVLLVGYPLLGLTYLADRDGAYVEPLFFISFSAIVAVELLAPAAPAKPRADRPVGR